MSKRMDKSSAGNDEPLPNPFAAAFGNASRANTLHVPGENSGEGVVSVPERETLPRRSADNGEPPDLSAVPRIILRRERKGHGGKTVTVAEGVPLCLDLDRIACALRKSLGCGSRIEEGTIVLQGDQVERSASWFVAHGVKKIVKG